LTSPWIDHFLIKSRKSQTKHNHQIKKLQKDKQRSTKHYTQKTSNTNLSKNMGAKSGASEGYAVPAPYVALIV